MIVILRRFERGSPQPIDQLVQLAPLSLGRGANQGLGLNDLRVPLAYAELSKREGRFSAFQAPFYIEAKTSNGVWVNGLPVAEANLNFGDVIQAGRFEITLVKPRAQDQGADVVLELREVWSAKEDKQQRAAAFQTRLTDTWASKRFWAWLLFVAALIPAWWLPYSAAQEQQSQQQTLQKNNGGRSLALLQHAKADVLWNSGPLSKAHQQLANNCAACHQAPFEQVSNASCNSCHAGTPNHAHHKAVLASPAFAEQKCTSCHLEHNGEQGLYPDFAPTCTSCHADPSPWPQAKLLPVKDWNQSHPAFAPQLAKWDGKNFVWQAQRQETEGRGQPLSEDTGLKYPHDIHLKPIQSPTGKQTLKCAACHTPDSDGVNFQPISMQKHCSECHKLDFDPASPNRVLPHGFPAEVKQVVFEYWEARALHGGRKAQDVPPPIHTGLLQIPGKAAYTPPATGGSTVSWAHTQAQKTLRDLYENRTCFYCHNVQKLGEGDYAIQPVNVQEVGIHDQSFNHSAHDTETCQSCHKAETSKVSSDVLLPDIQNCRQCHDDSGNMQKTASPCGLCHEYHVAPEAAPEVQP
jgi:hypothetical protein